MYKNKLKIWIGTLLLISAALSAASYELQYRCRNSNPAANQIQPHFNILNNSSHSLPLHNIKIRYYYTKEGAAAEQFYCDYAAAGSVNVNGSFGSGYVEIGFTDAAGSLPAGCQSGEIQVRFAKGDWSAYNQSDDYSFAPALVSLTNHSKVTLHLDGNLVWGTPPAGISPTPTVSNTPVFSIFPPSQRVQQGSAVVVEVHADTQDFIIAAYGMKIFYDARVLTIDSTRGSGGVTAGADGFVLAVNARNPGILTITGFDIAGKGPGPDLHFLDLYFLAASPGTSRIDIQVDTCADLNYVNFGGNTDGAGGTVTVAVTANTPSTTPVPRTIAPTPLPRLTPTPSSNPDPTPTPAPTQPGQTVMDIYQAEKAVWKDGKVETYHTRYTGIGYVNTANAAGTWIEFTVIIPADLNAQLAFVYANGSPGTRPAAISVNGSAPALSLAFGSTGNWTSWRKEPCQAGLSAGINTIRLTAATSGGLANLDRLEVAYSPGSTATPAVVPTAGAMATRTVQTPPTPLAPAPTRTATRMTATRSSTVPAWKPW